VIVVSISIIAIAWLLWDCINNGWRPDLCNRSLKQQTVLNRLQIYMFLKHAGKTVRQQAPASYKKSDVSGRHAFSAWFIEDIL